MKVLTPHIAEGGCSVQLTLEEYLTPGLLSLSLKREVMPGSQFFIADLRARLVCAYHTRLCLILIWVDNTSVCNIMWGVWEADILNCKLTVGGSCAL